MTWQAPGYAHRLDLGGGKTGRAFLAANEESGELVVIKYLSLENTYLEQVRTELLELSTLDSRYFVSVREVVEADEGIAVVMDPINGASLRALLRDGGALTAEASLLVFHETLTGLASAHSGGIVHGDVRPENMMVDLTGTSVMLDARAAAWVDRDITLGTGVYLAPERWRSRARSAAADVYAATVTFVEMLVGEPPYWEDSQLLALRYRHEQEEIPVEGVPAPLRELVRIGMAKDSEARADADALLAVVDVTAVAEYGPDWAATGRAALVSLVSRRQLAFGGVDAIESSAVVAAGELVELDDYYTEPDEVVGTADVEAAKSEAADVEAAEIESAGVEAAEIEAAETEPGEIESAELVAGDAEAAVSASEVVAVAAEIVELAGIEEMTASGISTEEDVLTEEEEAAVAEVEGMVAAVEEGVAVGTVAVEGMGIAATDEELVEIDETVVEAVAVEGVVFESEFAEGAFAAGAVAEGLIAGGAAAEGVLAGELHEEEVTGEIIPSEEGRVAGSAVAGAAIGSALIGGAAPAAGAAAGEVATGVAPVGPPPSAVGGATALRRHPWLVGAVAIFIVIIVAGVALALTGGPAGGPSTPRAEVTETVTEGGVVPPAESRSAGGVTPSSTPTPTAGTPSSGSVTPGVPVADATPSESPSAPGMGSSTKPPTTHKPKPSPTPTKLPVTGSSTGYTFGLAGLLLVVGTVLVVVARRRRA